MKSLLSLIALCLIGGAAHADHVLLECSIPFNTSRDARKVIVVENSKGLMKQEISRKGDIIVETVLDESQWRNKNIRLSNDSSNGAFRWLRYYYSPVFNQTGWYVSALGGGYQSEGRADCR